MLVWCRAMLDGQPVWPPSLCPRFSVVDAEHVLDGWNIGPAIVTPSIKWALSTILFAQLCYGCCRKRNNVPVVRKYSRCSAYPHLFNIFWDFCVSFLILFFKKKFLILIHVSFGQKNVHKIMNKIIWYLVAHTSVLSRDGISIDAAARLSTEANHTIKSILPGQVGWAYLEKNISCAN